MLPSLRAGVQPRPSPLSPASRGRPRARSARRGGARAVLGGGGRGGGPTPGLVLLAPGREEAVDEPDHVPVLLARDDVREDRELVGPALEVVVARLGAGQLVAQAQERARRVRLWGGGR